MASFFKFELCGISCWQSVQFLIGKCYPQLRLLLWILLVTLLNRLRSGWLLNPRTRIFGINFGAEMIIFNSSKCFIIGWGNWIYCPFMMVKEILKCYLTGFIPRGELRKQNRRWSNCFYLCFTFVLGNVYWTFNLQ